MTNDKQWQVYQHWQSDNPYRWKIWYKFEPFLTKYPFIENIFSLTYYNWTVSCKLLKLIDVYNSLLSFYFRNEVSNCFGPRGRCLGSLPQPRTTTAIAWRSRKRKNHSKQATTCRRSIPPTATTTCKDVGKIFVQQLIVVELFIRVVVILILVVRVSRKTPIESSTTAKNSTKG